MRRREFIIALGGVAGLPLTSSYGAFGQEPARPRRIAVLMGAAPSGLGESLYATFLQRLDQLGWNARNTRTEVRWWSGGAEQMRPEIAGLLASSPDVVMVFSNLALEVLKPMAGNVPVVFVGVGDPIGGGFVASLARPGGNVTGFAGMDAPMGSKWLEVLKETAPGLTQVLGVVHLETPAHRGLWNSAVNAAVALGIKAIPADVRNAADIERAVTDFAAQPNGGLIVLPHAVTWAHDDLIIALQIKHRVPALFATATSVAAGGLVSYGLDFEHSFRQTAEYVDRVLRGTQPGDLPVQQPSKFKLAFNLKTAKAIGFTVGPTLLSRADEVIE